MNGEEAFFRKIFSDMLREICSGDSLGEAFCQEWYRILALKLIRSGLLVQAAEGTALPHRDSAALKALIAEHYSEELDLDELAARLHMNKYHMAHRFTAAYGISPIRYLTQIRIREAKCLLVHTDHSIAEIAAMVGFSTQSYFAQTFRNVCGESASAYRRRIASQT